MIQTIDPISLALTGEPVRIGDQLRETIEAAILWKAEGFGQKADACLAAVSSAFARAANIRARIQEAREARAAAVSLAPATLPETERGREPPQVARFDKLRRKLDDKTLNEKQRQATVEEMGKIERAPSEDAERKAVNRHVEALAALEAMRGGDVSRDHAGRPRVARDGLATLIRGGALDVTQARVLKVYRRLFEAVAQEKRLTSAYNEMRGGGFDPEITSKQLRARHKLQWTLKGLDALVDAAGVNGREITTLRLVAGEARTINSISPTSSNRKLNTEALIRAADTLADNWGLQ